MQVISIVGARPQFVKLAPMSAAFARAGIDHIIVHTGQHYDHLLSDSFFDELNIPRPDHLLAVGSTTHGRQTGEMMIELESILEASRPDWVLVYGDTNSTLAAALVAAKLNIPLAHLEAGLRSFNRTMPEEHNRILTDHAADLLLAPTKAAADHLMREGLADRTRVVGDVMTDVLYRVRDEVSGRAVPFKHSADDYYVATIHRPQNTDDSARLLQILESLSQLDAPVYLLAHPRLQAIAKKLDLDQDKGSLHWHAPLPYPELVCAVSEAKGVITDSGGLQKEAFLLRTPCVTVRTETEWVETIDLGWNILVQPGEELVDATRRPRPANTSAAPYGDGNTADHVAEILIQEQEERS